MAANTGPDANSYMIPEVELADTFNTWRDVTNTQTYKLNKLKVYEGVSSSSINVTTSGGGTLQAVIADNVGKGVTFLQPVVFSSGVTFNGDVTFNAQTFTVNANNVTIDDYSLVLGATGAANNNDTNINTAGGGGLFLNRGTAGETAAWIWRATSIKGLTGIWGSNAHIGLCGASAGLYPNNGGVLPVYGTGLRLNGSAISDHGLEVTLNGSGANSVIAMSRYAPPPSGTTAFAEILSGSTYGTRPFMKINDGANRKTVIKSGHGFWFGAPVRFDGTTWVLALANDEASAEVAGIVSNLIDSQTFEITFIGEIFGNFSSANADGGALTPGATYYLSPFVSGKITSVQPRSSGMVHKAVLLATGANSAIVLPFTGGLLTSTLNISNTSSIGTRINQLNRFKMGDVVRFKGGTRTLRYNVGNGITLEEVYSNGAYVRAQANTEAEGEVAGMVIGVDLPVYYPTGAPGATAYKAFDVLMDGWFDGLPASTFSSVGSVHFLATNCAAADTGTNVNTCLETAASSFTTTAPISGVVKPMLMATSDRSGYLYSYRGNLVSPSSGTVNVDISTFLVQDIRAGQTGDLKINVHQTATTSKESITIATGNKGTFTTSVGITTGHVGVGGIWSEYNSGNSNQSRILANLDVNGTIRAGFTLDATTPRGQDLLVARGSGDAPSGVTMESRTVIGTRHTTSNLVLCRDVRPDPNSTGFISSRAGLTDRGVLELGVSGTESALIWKIAESSAEVGNSVPLTDVFSIVGLTAALAGSANISGRLAVDTDTFVVDNVTNRVGIGTASPTVMLDVNGLARSNVAVTAITDNKHLATKEYVDSKQFSGVWTTFTVQSGTWIQNLDGKTIWIRAVVNRQASSVLFPYQSVYGDVASTSNPTTWIRADHNEGPLNGTRGVTVSVGFFVPAGYWYRIVHEGNPGASSVWGYKFA